MLRTDVLHTLFQTFSHKETTYQAPHKQRVQISEQYLMEARDIVYPVVSNFAKIAQLTETDSRRIVRRTSHLATNATSLLRVGRMSRSLLRHREDGTPIKWPDSLLISKTGQFLFLTGGCQDCSRYW